EGDERDPPGAAAAARAARRLSGRCGVTAHVSGEELEARALGQLCAPRAAEAQSHAAGCAECARELQWARAEQALFSRRSPKSVDALWAGVAARLGKERKLHRPHWARRIVLTAAAAAAA